MSVQAGIWNFDGRPVDRTLLENLSESLRQQGPDGESNYTDTSIALLYRPFHTTAESRREKQPHVSRRGAVVTWDGRLDNREALIADLRSELDASPTDVAIFAAAFDCWDTDCFRRIVGDWAVSIWKPDQRELLFASDYMAIRHIFYYLKSDRIWWSTDLSPLVLLSGDRFHIDDDYIAGYFAHEPDAHLTPYREIREVPPGQFVRIRSGGVSVERFWRFSPKSRIRYRTDAEYEEHFHHVFRQSVRRRLRSDSPILAELSGGLDSSSIVCMADEIVAKEGTQTPCLDTLSYYDKTEPNGDDWVYFPKIEEKRRRRGHHIDGSKLALSESLVYSDFCPLPGQLGCGQNIENERIAVVRNGKYRVVLTGIGGDEFLGGIPDPSAQLGDLILQLNLKSLAAQLLTWSLIKRQPWVCLLKRAGLHLLPPTLGRHFVKLREAGSWVDTNFANRTALIRRLLAPAEHFGLMLPTRRSCIAGVLLMANKLAKLIPSVLALQELRHPYLDQQLIEFVLAIPACQLLRPGERRSLMRRALVNIVPQEVLDRPTKQLARRSSIVMMQRTADQILGLFNSSMLSALGYIKQTRFVEEFNTARSGQVVHIVRLMKTAALELWMRDVVSRGLIDAGPGSQLASAALPLWTKCVNAQTYNFSSVRRHAGHSKKGGQNNELLEAGTKHPR